MDDRELQTSMTNLELRASNPDGTEGEGLSHRSMAGLFLLYSLEIAAPGEPWTGVCVVHDQGDHGERYRALADLLAYEGMAVALPAFRGHGKSEGERGHSWGIPEMVRDIGSVTDHLAYMMGPEASRVLLGVGLGGFYSICHAIDKPGAFAAIVLISPTLNPRFEVPEKKGGLSGLFKKVSPTSPGRVGWSVDEITSLDAERAAWRNDERTHDVVSVRTAQAVGEARSRYLARVGEIDCPVLILHGADDTIGSPEESKALGIPNAEVRIVDGARHDLFHDVGAQASMEAVRDWIVANVKR